jgi:hypothetical protein
MKPFYGHGRRLGTSGRQPRAKDLLCTGFVARVLEICLSGPPFLEAGSVFLYDCLNTNVERSWIFSIFILWITH